VFCNFQTIIQDMKQTISYRIESKKIRFLSFFFFGFLFTACQSEPTFTELSSQSIKMVSVAHENDTMRYHIALPMNWAVVNNAHTETLIGEYFMDTLENNKNQAKSSFSVSVYKGEANDLKKEFEIEMKRQKEPQNKGFEIIDSGKTDYLSYPSYFVHVKSADDKGNEYGSIGFLVKSKEDSTFYSFSVSIPKNDDYKLKMGAFLKCMKGFHMK
jgi:hypothetical protein